MADTKALRERLLQKIAVLEEKLRAVDLVEELDKEEGGSTEKPIRQRRTHKVRRKHATAADEKTIQEVAGELLSGDWMRVQEYHALVRKVFPDVRLAAVSTAMRRLVERGIAEKRGKRKEGLQYRTKKEAP